MKQSLTAGAAVFAALILAGCSGSGPSADDKKYAEAVTAADPADFSDIPTDKLAHALGSEGDELCGQLKRGSFEAAAAYAKTEFSDTETAALISAAVLVYCPDQKSKIPKG
ncbi:DUF732 domain-containing protein [Streptomyces sp. BK340]|uniref:DUF732 domain-containing protein n=1 Tax=Streptomyces sp. BK340 TaxID=2572903 RepID=UPI0011A29BCC|nr:DUF732 domain-containing protein [Streptomyces sp. BK340]TVZ84913.1 uncharacterized protein DUF732 [Streptomyces sp. BK340]